MLKPTKKQLSIKKILWTDYPAFIYTSLAVVAWVVYLAWTPAWRKDGPIIQPELAPYALAIALIFSFLCICIVFYRFHAIKSVFEKGIEVRGKITEIKMPRDRGKVNYSFFYNSKEFSSHAILHRNKQTLALKQGDRVTLVIDPEQPIHAFIRDLFIET